VVERELQQLDYSIEAKEHSIKSTKVTFVVNFEVMVAKTTVKIAFELEQRSSLEVLRTYSLGY